MADAAKIKEIGPFSGSNEYVRGVYDFSNDGGAQGTIVLARANEDCVVDLANTRVKTAMTSGGAATVKIGTTADDDAILADVAFDDSSLDEGNVADGASKGLKVAEGEEILLTISTADLTAGVVEVGLVVSKF